MSAPHARRVDLGDVRLHVELRGAGPELLLLHGFTGDGTTWQEVAEDLARDHRVLTLDLLGHGRSDAPAGVKLAPAIPETMRPRNSHPRLGDTAMRR